jgi:hypothetical protein
LPSLQGNPLALAWKSSFALYSTTVFLYGASVYAGANRKLPEPRSAALAIVLIAISLSYVANMFFYDVPNYFGFSVLPGINLEVMLDFSRIILVAAIVVTLASDMEYFYRIPIDVYSISVIQASSGVCAYSYVRDPESANPELFASAITAISMFMKETSKSSSALKSIKTGSRTIMVEGREEDGFIVMAVVERSSLVLVRSLHMFADLFAEKYRGKVRDGVIIAQDYTDADLMIYIAFPHPEAIDDTDNLALSNQFSTHASARSAFSRVFPRVLTLRLLVYIPTTAILHLRQAHSLRFELLSN